MLKLYAAMMLLFCSPKTQVVSIKQADSVLDVSVLIRAKQYDIDPHTSKIVRGLAGCSGTFVSGTEVLTAAHCFDRPTTDIWVRGKHDISYKANLLRLDVSHDLALLSVKQIKNHPYARVAKTVRVGEQVINVGSPVIFEFLVSEGIVATTDYRTKRFKSSYLITTAMINAGSSGGGAFNDKGEIIGVNVMSIGFFGWTGISMAVDGNTVREFLNGNL